MEKYGIQIATLQEIIWPGIGKHRVENGSILYSGKENVRAEGVGFYLTKRAEQALMGFQPISSRIATLRIRAQWFNITMICVHANTNETEGEVKDEWYEQLQEVLDKVPKHDLTILLGDLNAKVGREIEAFQGVLGRHSLRPHSNDNGIRLATLAMHNNFVIGGTVFPHKDVHKGTWISPGGRIVNQIDHILIKRKFRSSLLDTRVMRSADCDSDHMLVIGKIRVKLKMNRKGVPKTAKLDIEGLGD